MWIFSDFFTPLRPKLNTRDIWGRLWEMLGHFSQFSDIFLKTNNQENNQQVNQQWECSSPSRWRVPASLSRLMLSHVVSYFIPLLKNDFKTRACLLFREMKGSWDVCCDALWADHEQHIFELPPPPLIPQNNTCRIDNYSFSELACLLEG